MCGFYGAWGLHAAVIDNKAGAIYDLAGDGDILLGTVDTMDGPVHSSPGSSVILNQGTFRKSVGSGESVIEPSFNNAGRVEVQSGTVAFTGGFTQTAGSIRLDGGSVASTSPLSIAGRSIEGRGDILAHILNQGGTVSPGFSPGALTIDGDYTQGHDATLLIEMAGLQPGQFDVLNVTGTAALDGLLKVSFLDGFRPRSGDMFTVLTYGSHFAEFDSIFVMGLPSFEFIADYGISALTLRAEGVEAVPLPPSVWLAAMGLLGSLCWMYKYEHDGAAS